MRAKRPTTAIADVESNMMQIAAATPSRTLNPPKPLPKAGLAYTASLSKIRPMGTRASPTDSMTSNPYVAEMAGAVTHEGALGGCDDDAEFEFALDIILDGLDRLQRG